METSIIQKQLNTFHMETGSAATMTSLNLKLEIRNPPAERSRRVHNSASFCLRKGLAPEKNGTTESGKELKVGVSQI